MHRSAGRISLLVATLAIVVPTFARADIRLWQTDPDEPGTQRYFDFTGFLQPGFIHRANDHNAPLSDDNFWLRRASLPLTG